MKHNSPDEWVDDFLAREELDDFRQASLRDGLALLQKRRVRRRQIRILSVALLPLLLALGLWTNRSAMQSPPSSHSPARSTSVTTGKVRLINDDDLLALFPNRPLALIGGPGHRKLVFLDQPSSNRQQ